jgi:hypothetical protein
VAELERQVSEALRAARETRGPLKEELDQRLRTVSEQLVKKQEQLDASICETYALGARLKSAEQRVRGLEDQLVEARSAAGNGDGLFDLESAGWQTCPSLAVTQTIDGLGSSRLSINAS